MAGFRALVLHLLIVVFALGLTEASETDSGGDEGQVYIVYMGHLSVESGTLEADGGLSAVEVGHHNLLEQVLDGSPASDRILHSYKRSLNGFAARLTEQEAQALSSMDSVVSVFPSRTHQLLTTRSWDFLGFPPTPQSSLPLEGDVIIGMLDSGVWPDSPSFSDDGLGPPPTRWKGSCHNFTCNNKIIGARVYGGDSPVDVGGHGSHTASTVAGRAVGGVGLAGLAGGTARGAVPGARLAVYKVCHLGRCGEADILAAFDDAVADGVDVISFSIGSSLPSPYFSDAAAIGSFHAMRRGVVTSTAAGNFGPPNSGRVTNVAPWLLSVAASSIDRRLVDKIILGNGNTIVGASVNTFPTLVNATLAFPTNGSCFLDGLAGVSFRGKIVLCPKQNFLNTGTGPFRAGSAGAVIVGDHPDTALAVPLPALMVTQEQFDEIMAYVNSTSNPVGTIDSTETTSDPQAPIAASFSSPGPNLITPEILKPDISAPGIDIIAAWTPLSSPTGLPDDKRSVLYNIESGTSMACPHVTGAAAYVKSFHRDWSPAMIMSALITTASPVGADAGGELKHGAGQLSPVKARDPGLVYDATERDYVDMLCTQGYNTTQLAIVTGSNATACGAAEGGSVFDLNYPTMAVHVAPGEWFTARFPRTVTNVGDRGAVVYEAKVVAVRIPAAANMSIDVVPSRLEFSPQFRSMEFTVSVSGVVTAADEVASVAVVWTDGGEHEVRSPVVVYTVDVDTPEEGST